VNAIAAFERYGAPACGGLCTATTFDVISAKRSTWARHRAAGISAEALYSRTARLSAWISSALQGHRTITVTHLQSGLYYGYIGLVDGILSASCGTGRAAAVIATGGLAANLRGLALYIAEINICSP